MLPASCLEVLVLIWGNRYISDNVKSVDKRPGAAVAPRSVASQGRQETKPLPKALLQKPGCLLKASLRSTWLSLVLLIRSKMVPCKICSASMRTIHRIIS